MKSRVFFYVIALWAAALIIAAVAKAQTIYVENNSTALTTSALQDALPAFQAATNQDFYPIWHQTTNLVLGVPLPGGEYISIENASDVPGALGYHSVADNGTPYAKVFMESASWQVTFTHELWEMLADPYINTVVKARRFWLVEVGDPVEADRFSYSRPSASGQPVFISDFVYPSWYRLNGKAPFDFTRKVKIPFQILCDGYATFWNFNIANWQNRNARPCSFSTG